MQEFFRSIALCHTVQISEKTVTSIYKSSENVNLDMPEYQASSPDEKALIEACFKFGYQFIDDENEEIQLKIVGKDDYDAEVSTF